jgi:hypothetical protein
MQHLGAEYFRAEDQPLQFKFKTPFGSLSTLEMGEETSVSSALRPPVPTSSLRSRSPPLWRPSRSPGLTDKRLVLIEDALTGRLQTTRLSQVFADVLFNDDSVQAGVPTTTDVKNKTGWRLWEEYLREIGGNTPLLRRSLT